MPGERELSDLIAAADREDALEQVLALGFCVYKKWDRVQLWEELNKRPISSMQYKTIASGFSERDLLEFRATAHEALKRYVHKSIGNQVAEITQEISTSNARSLKEIVSAHHTLLEALPVERNWRHGFWQSFWATAAWSGILLLFYLIAKYLGSDLYNYVWIPLKASITGNGL